ncbi:MAG: phospholipase [Chitinivibrionales bacterium]|nr:phospholipase [Chitinivibrionales bacterium]MBD3397361.1 phospholipase [Chitinivibrionales bacterium]
MPPDIPGFQFITGSAIYWKVIREAIPGAHEFVWIATSDIKDLHAHKGRKMVPFLEYLSDLVRDGIAVRLLHAKEPGPAFRKDFDRYPDLIEGMERILCPRVHFKCVIVDGAFAYSGSANLTGAGMGTKSERRRNFESGFITTNTGIISGVMAQFDAVWMGKHCPQCDRKGYCADAKDMIEGN